MPAAAYTDTDIGPYSEPVKLTLQASASWVHIDTTSGNIYGTPVVAATGESITIRVTDPYNRYCDITKTYDVSDNNKPLYDDDGTAGPGNGVPFVDFLEVLQTTIVYDTIKQPMAAFVDLDIGVKGKLDEFTYYAKMHDGSALPAWLAPFENDGTYFRFGNSAPAIT